jgi:wyosine [tRNA(Phe)-imidazoG37] synthetase (radical SAM superfamily)
MSGQAKYLFGPVASRRLGLSLGVDIVELKSCSQNCLYCQLGIDGVAMLERKPFVPIDDVIEELKAKIQVGLEADYITISGSGEPTLNSQLGLLIDKIKQVTDIPVAVITNATLLGDAAVRADCSKADVVLPSLDAGDAKTFDKINRPHKDINFDAFVKGLCLFRAEYTGQMWLEVFFCEGVNSQTEQVERIYEIIQRIKPDKIHLNTVARPPADGAAFSVHPKRLALIAVQLGPNAEVVADFSTEMAAKAIHQADSDQILAMLARRPCSLDDICQSMGLNRAEVVKNIAFLEKNGLVVSQRTADQLDYKVK